MFVGITSGSVLVVVVLSCHLVITKGQDAVRLANGTYGPHMGRLEVLHNGMWGTVCSEGFFKPSADVACRRLGYPKAAVCLVPWGAFGSGEGPIWMNRVRCTGTEMTLGNCSFPGWGVVDDCLHSDDVGVICFDERVLSPPSVQFLQSTTNTISLQITAPEFPIGTAATSYNILYVANGSTTTPTSVIVPGVFTPQVPINYTLTGLSRGTAYSLQVQAQIQYPGTLCTGYLSSASSLVINASTQINLPPSALQIRLASTDSNFANIGRLEVLHNNQWGTVCDYGSTFSVQDADIVCHMLNFTHGALCSVSNAALGAGTGPVWLSVKCSAQAEILDQCTHSDWGASGCGHNQDVGVVCIPENISFNLSISNTTATSVSLKWTPYPSSPYVTSVQYWIRYSQPAYPSPAIVNTFQTAYTLTGLLYGTPTTISMWANIQYSPCMNKYMGGYQPPVVVTTKEDAPYSPPANFKVLVLNSTAAQVHWTQPNITNLNGRIRGYRLFYRPEGMQETMFTIDGNGTQTYTVGDLTPATAYFFTILAYTLEDGPRAAPVTVVTKEIDYVPYIIVFGINGNGLDNTVRMVQDAGVRVLCGAGLHNASALWYTSGGVVVGMGNGRGTGQSHFQNGTAVLEIAPNGFLSLCDAGRYTCRAMGASGGRDEREFSLMIGTTPPAPLRPEPVQIQSTFIEVCWTPPPCTGGHYIIGYTIRYKEVLNVSTDYHYIFNINQTAAKYAIGQLKPSSTYLISVQSTDARFATSPFSYENTIATLPPAPSSPLNITATLILPNVVELQWEPPLISNGNIVYYTVYGTPLTLYEVTKGVPVVMSAGSTVEKVFSATASVGMVTINTFNVVYQFQMTASVYIGTVENEGQLSDVTSRSTVFVPQPELPAVQGLQLVNISNTSVCMAWSPPNTSIPVLYYQVNVTGEVTWRSSSNGMVTFQHVRQFSTLLPVVSIVTLVPNTSYTLSVRAVFGATGAGAGAFFGAGAGAGAFFGAGAVSSLTVATSAPVGERLAYFQVRLTPVYDCVQWTSENTTSKLNEITTSLLRTMNSLCGCALGPANLIGDQGGLSCRGSLQGGAMGGATGGVVYRGGLIGTDTISAGGLVQLLQGWVAGGRVVAVGGLVLGTDPNCTASVSGPDDPDCMVQWNGPEGMVGEVPTRLSSDVAIAVGTVGGAVGLQLAILIALVLVLTYRSWKRKPISTIDLNSHQLAVMESGHSLLKDASRRNTDSPENATTHSPEDACNLSMLENHSNFDSIPHIVFEDDRSTIVCEDTNSTVPLEGTRKITPVEGTSSKTHLEDSRTLIRNIGTCLRDSGVDVGSSVDIKMAGTS